MKTAIKFCGLTRADDARMAAELGATYMGAIFAPSARRVTPGEAADMWAEIQGPRKVGVFGEASVSEILEVADACGLDVLQLHLEPSHDKIEKLRTSFRGDIWAVVRIGEAGMIPGAGESAAADAVLIDSYSESGLGGTGRTFDWEREAAGIRRLVGEKPLVVAGGLDPDNVAAAIRALTPAVVDVSSGVETSPGVKDHARMRAFASAVEQADAN